MKKIVNIPGSSGKTPFETGAEQYFYCTNYEISTLSSRAMMPYADSEIYLQMGYTGLDWLLRVGLFERESGVYLSYPDEESKHFEPEWYFVIGDRSHGSPTPVHFPNLKEAEDYLKNLDPADQSKVYVVARRLSSEDWH